MKFFFWFVEDLVWNCKCSYASWLHGPYGLSKVIEQMPFRFLIKYLRKYGATIGEGCIFERGINLHRPHGKKHFENLIIGNNVYLGHNTLIDLSRKVIIKDRVIIASKCQLWTHASFYGGSTLLNNQYGEKYGNIIIKEGALIYSNSVIVNGVQIGKFAQVGACSLVNKNINDYTFVGGVPAKEISTKK